MEHNYDFSGEENNMAQGTVPHMDYYNQYPMNSAHIHGPHFDHTYNTLHNSNYNLGGTGEKYSNIHSSPKQQLPSGSTSESFGYPVDFGPGFSLNEKSPTQGKGVLDIPPDSSPNGEYLVDFRNSNENESTHETSTELLKSNQVQPRTELTKIGKTTRHSASTTQKPKVPRQLATDRNVTKVHTSSRLKKNQQDLPIESASESLQQPDPFAQWYQMMSQYYNQFYPGYQMVQQPTLPQQSVPHRSSNRSTKVVSQPQELQMPSGNQTGSFDYVNYYYQYYAAAAAAQMWSGAHPSHLLSTTVNEVPRFYNTPHIKAWMGCPGVIVQILPSRPLDGELARVELIDLSELADEAVADAAKRAADTSGGSLIRTRDPYFIPQQPEQNAHFSITDSGMQTPSRLSSIPAGGAGDEDTEEMRACAAITACWDRVDHVFYPGPLDRVGTLKADVLAFLREKLSEIQDRLPIDWESAALLLMFLEALVKNNGNLQTSDLVHLLLEGHEPTTSTFRSSSYAGGTSNSYLGVHAPIHYSSNFNHFSQVDGYMNESLISLPSSQVQSGRTSPDSHFEIDYSATSLLRHGNKAASETGGLASVQNIIRRVAAVNIGTGLRSQESEDKLLDRFRELLMHGLPIKALEHACRSKLWGHAFTLAHRLGPPTFMKVMDRFMNNDISMSDPILTLYQLTAGEMPQVINSAAYGKGCDSGDWRPHLAMILATHSTQLELSLTALERLGDGLLSRKHIYAAHLCYLLMNTLKYSNKIEDQREFQLPAKIWLIGVPPYNDAMNTESIGRNLNGIGLGYFQSPLFATSEAIQLTEIYEYASQLANRKYRLRQLLPFRLIYAIRLLDAGLVEKAYQYLTAIGNEILLEFDENLSKNNLPNESINPLLYCLTSNCLRFVEPLQYHSEIDSFDIQLNTTQIDYGFGFTVSSSTPQISYMNTNNKDKNWIRRLSEIYEQMNRKVNYPLYHSANFQSNMKKTNISLKDVHFTNTDINVNQSSHHTNIYNYSIQELNCTTSPEHKLNVQNTPLLSGDNEQVKMNMNSPHNRISQGTDDSCVFQGVKTSEHNVTVSNNECIIASSLYSSMRSKPGQLEYTPQTAPNVSSSFIQSQMFNHEISTQQSTYTHPQQSYSSSISNVQRNHDQITNGSSIHLSKCLPSSSSSNQVYSTLQSYTNDDIKKSNTIPYSMEPQFSPQHHSTIHSSSSKQSVSGNMFFTPLPQTDSYTDTSSVSNQQAFDYFANIESIHTRSRTVSGDSERNTACITNPSGSFTDQTPSVRSRNNSGPNYSYQNSLGNERQYQMQSQQQQQQQQQQSTNSSISQPSRFSTQISTHPSSVKDDINEDYITERLSQVKSKEYDNLDKNQQSKDGWLSGWFGRLKKNGAKNIHLPDDSKPSIVWDDRLKQWIDINDPDGSELNKVPPPPPMTSFTPKISEDDESRTLNPPSYSTFPVSNLTNSTAYHHPPTRISNPRSRYVNIMSNQTSETGTTKLESILQPPLPYNPGGARL